MSDEHILNGPAKRFKTMNIYSMDLQSAPRLLLTPDENASVEKKGDILLRLLYYFSSESWWSETGGSFFQLLLNHSIMTHTKDGGNVEWSATGRVGFSLTHESAAPGRRFFSFQRAASRLVKMSGKQWQEYIRSIECIAFLEVLMFINGR
jgi:hypothetical protein